MRKFPIPEWQPDLKAFATGINTALTRNRYDKGKLLEEFDNNEKTVTK